MDFTRIGNINSFVKQKNLLFAANYKIKTGQRLVDDNGTINFARSVMFSQTQTSKTDTISSADKTRLNSIKQKLKSGKKLSGAEMAYLREKDEKLYQKAKYADEAREALKADLRAAKTKQEARQAVMRATARLAADCAADFEALKGGGGGISLSAGMNFGGDALANPSGGFAVSVNSGTENLNVDGGEVSAEVQNAGNEISADAQNASGEVSADTQNATGENSNATNETNNNENPFEQMLNANNDSDSSFDILDKYLYAIQAIQNEWLEFIKTEDYKDLPEDIIEKAEMKLHGDKKNKTSSTQAADAILTYREVMSYRKAL